MTPDRDGGRRLPDRPALRLLGAALAGAGFSEQGVATALETAPQGWLDPADRLVHVRRLAGRGALSALVRLFLLGLAVPADEIAAAAAPLTAEDLCALGLAAWTQDGLVRARVRITPHDGLLLAHDPELGHDLDRDHVGGVGPAARTLASLTIRRPGVRALDLGTGCGLQALLASRHAARVLATDVNPRALWFAACNAALNGLENVELRETSLFESIADERFDLVVANPPFVISPDHELVFRDGGLDGDEMSRAVVAGAAGVLAPGGTAHVLCNWALADPTSAAPVAAWAAGSGCDLLVLHYETVDPLTYAARWAPLGGASPHDGEARLDRWLDYYRAAGIAAIGLGAAVLRRPRDGPGRARTVRMTSRPVGAAGGQVARMIDAGEQRAAVADDALALACVFALIDGHRLDQALIYDDGRYAAGPAHLVLDDSVGLTGEVDPLALHVVLRIDGRRTLGEIVGQARDETGLDGSALTRSAIDTVRELLDAGLMTCRTPPPVV
jgi:methylase of polypeptide subunit release factors